MSNATDGKTFSHFCLSLEGALRWPKRQFDRQFKGCIRDDDGTVMSTAAAREKFQILLSKGIKLIPAGKCDNFDPYDKGCLGHPVKPEVAA